MRRLTVDSWSRRTSVLHRLDSRVKLISCILLCVASRNVPWSTAALLISGLTLSRLPLVPFVVRLAAVLTFAGTLAATTALSGQPDRALLLFRTATLSATAVLLLIGTTPFNAVLAALRWFRVPHALADTIWFMQRYLSVLAEQAGRMRMAATARGAGASVLVSTAQLGVLFGSATSRSQRVHAALLARGWTGGPLQSANVRGTLGMAEVLLLTLAIANLGIGIVL